MSAIPRPPLHYNSNRKLKLTYFKTLIFGFDKLLSKAQTIESFLVNPQLIEQDFEQV